MRDSAPISRRYVPMREAAYLSGRSRSNLYKLGALKKLELVSLDNRTFVTSASLNAYIDSAKPYVPGASEPRGFARTRQAARKSAAAKPGVRVDAGAPR